MSKKVWKLIFLVLLVIYITFSIFISNEPLWVRILGLLIVIMWGLLTPIIEKNDHEKSI